MITIFNIGKVARKLSENKLRDTHKLFYLIVPVVFLHVAHANDVTLTALGYGMQDSPIVPLALLNTVLSAFLLAGGIAWMWLINRQGDGKNFLERFICLSFPIQVYLQIAALFFHTWAFYWLQVGSLRSSSPGTVYALTAMAFVDLTIVVHFLWLGRWMKRLSHRLL